SKPHSEAGTAFIQTQQLHAATADAFLEHMCRLDVDSPPITAWNTGIICTIGPASRSVETLKEMIKSGMNVARLSFFHGTHEYHAETIKNVCAATESFASDPILYWPVAVALDTKGPEIRTGLMKGSGTAEVELKKGATLKIMLDNTYMEKCDENILWLDYKNICKVVEVGSKIYVDDGFISFQVKQKGADFPVTEVENDGSLGSKKGVNLPGAAVTCLQLMFMKLGRGLMKSWRPVMGSWWLVVIEALKFLQNLSSVPLRCPAPPRLRSWMELAVSRCLETAKGDYPLEAMHMQHLIASEAEAAIYHLQLFEELHCLAPITSDPTEATAVGAMEASFKCCSGAIIVLTKCGRYAHQLARYHPRAPIIAVTWNPQTARQAHLYRGIFPGLCKDPIQEAWAEDVDLRVNLAMNVAKARGCFKKGDVVIVLTGWRPGSGFTNTMSAVAVP
uniref:pyruvate kinase n=1 Tax=Cebus imitator TaxID=2715852 RepID=A0A2K5R7P5_CEBIM